MKKNYFLLAMPIIACVLVPQASLASTMREAHGQPCQSREKTYYGEDGSTPRYCEMIGPAYEFKIFANGFPIWEGSLPAGKDSLPYPSDGQPSPAEGVNSPYSPARAGVFVGRCSEFTSEPGLFSFGESRLVGINAVTDGSTTIHFPLVEGARFCIRVPSGQPAESLFEAMRPDGSITLYRIIVKHQKSPG